MLTSHWVQTDAEKGVQCDNNCLIVSSSRGGSWEGSPDFVAFAYFSGVITATVPNFMLQI